MSHYVTFGLGNSPLVSTFLLALFLIKKKPKTRGLALYNIGGTTIKNLLATNT